MKKKILTISLIGTRGVPANYGGFETLAENLVQYLEGQYAFKVYCTSIARKDKPGKYRNAELVYVPLQANGIQSTIYDIVSICKAIWDSDILLILGVSGCVCLTLVRKLFRGKIIVHIDGLEWKREKWKFLARLFLKYSEMSAIKYSDTIIADNLAIKEYVKVEYKKDSSLIEYGGDHVIPENKERSFEWRLAFARNGYAIKVCRIEPENNVGMILDAFSKTNSMPLVVIGNWANSAYGRNLREKYTHYSKIALLDPIYDKAQLYQLRSNAAIYVHGHSAGGTNPSLVEAMYLGLPIIAFDVQYNRETTRHKAIYFKSNGDLESILKGLDSLDLSSLGGDMKEVALKYYKWSDIAAKYVKLFSITGDGHRPISKDIPVCPKNCTEDSARSAGPHKH